MNRSDKSKLRQILLGVGITLVFGAVYFYFALPAINLHDPEFYTFAIAMAVVYCISQLVLSGWLRLRHQLRGEAGTPAELAKDFFSSLWKSFRIPVCLVAVLILLQMLGSLWSWELFHAGEYHDLLPVEQGDFLEDVDEISFDRIPLLDRASAEKLADRKLGELADMVSQFEVSSEYNTQINYQGRPVRVTPLEYGDLIKWFNNHNQGLPAYLIIDMITQNVELVRLEDGIKYTPNELFNNKLERHLRFNYPTFMFDTPVFEIDEDGTPYWVCPRIVKTIGLFGGTDINGVVLVNAVTGECQYYGREDVPTWVDHVYSADIIIQQYDYYGMYQNGFFNSIFGQKDVTVTTDGYNYIAQNDDVYVYTGVTSVGEDQSNVGFILTNQRTKESSYYHIAGATEYSAMASAEGLVQNLHYTATFPLLMNIHSQPTYFMALKDDAGLVKMYAMVNVQQYQVVATGKTVSECSSNYASLLVQNSINAEEVITGTEITGEVSEIRSAVIDGNTCYYIRLQDSEVYYVISAADAPLAVILNVGDKVRLSVVPGTEDTKLVTGLSLDIQ